MGVAHTLFRLVRHVAHSHRPLSMAGVLALLLVMPAVSEAAPCADYAQTIHTRNSIEVSASVAKFHDNGYLYLQGNRIRVLDIADSLHPVVVSQTSTSQTGTFGLHGDHMFVSTGGSAFRSFDISNPLTDPVELQTLWGVLDYAYEIVTNGTVACAADGNDGLVCFDVTDPANMVASDVLDTIISADALFLDGNTCYVVSDDLGDPSYLYVVDVSDPYAVTLLGSYDMGGDHGEQVAVSGTHAFVTTVTGKLVVIDVSTSSTPTLVTSLALAPSEADRIQIAGTIAYVSTAASETQLHAVDVSNPAAPVELGDGAIRDTRVFAVAGPWAYQPIGSYLDIVDISAASGVAALDQLNPIPFSFGAGPMTVSGDYAYNLGSGSNDFNVIDVSDPTNLSVVASTGLTGSSYSDVVKVGDYAYAAMGTSGPGLVVVDVSDPLAPAEVATLSVDAFDLAVSGSHLMVASGGAGVVPVDISNPLVPVAGTALLGGTPVGVSVSGSYVYVQGLSGAPFVADISNPMNPVLETMIPGVPSSSIEAVEAFGDLLVVSDWTSFPLGNLSMLDISDPTAPVVVGSTVVGAAPQGLAKLDNYVYGASLDLGLLVIDVEDPTDPQTLGGASAGRSTEIEIAGETVFVSSPLHDRFYAYPVQCASGASNAIGLPALGDGGLASRVHPNPFQASTTIAYSLGREDRVSVTVYDLHGRVVRRLASHERRTAGTHRTRWDGLDEGGAPVSSGVYFYRIETRGQAESRRIVRIK